VSNATQQRRINKVEHEAVQLTQQMVVSGDPQATEALGIVCQTTVGHRAFPGIKSMFQQVQELQQLKNSMQRMIHDRTVSRKTKDTVVVHMTNGMTLGTAAAVTGLQPRRVCAMLNRVLKPKREVIIGEDCEEESILAHEAQRELYVMFFESHTHVLSGAKHLTRVLKLAHKELFFLLYAEYPSLLRQQCASHKNLLSWAYANSKKKFAVHLIEASRAQLLNNFVEKDEQKQRLGFIHANYMCERAKARKVESADYKILPSSRSCKVPDLPKDSPLPKVVPLSDRTVWRILGQEKKEGRLRWTENFKPYPCKIHDEGPQHVAAKHEVS
jgi:hypothetical protein